MKSINKKLKNFLRKFFLIDDTPAKVAGGAALGVFSGIVPGEGVLTALFFAYIFRLNRLATLAGVFATNMWVTVLVLPVAAFFGGLLFGIEPRQLIDNFQANYHLGWKSFLSEVLLFEVALPLFVGYVVVGVLIAALAYFSLFFLLKYKKISFHQ